MVAIVRNLITTAFAFLIVTPNLLYAQDRYDGPIIDMHLHAQDSIWAERRLCFPKPCEGEATIANNIVEVRAMTLAAMDQHNIVLGFLSGSPERLVDWEMANPSRFIASPHIGDPTTADLARLRQDYVAGRYAGMGEIASQYYGYAPADPEVAPFFALGAEFDVPTHVHTLGIGAPLQTFRVSNGDPRLLEEVLVRHPNLRIFVENCGFPFTDAMSAMMYQYPQLYCDISTILHLTPRDAAFRHLQSLIDNGLSSRIMFGSDQMIWPEVIEVAIEAIQSAKFLTKEQKADIFYNNAARFLQLSDRDIATHHSN